MAHPQFADNKDHSQVRNIGFVAPNALNKSCRQLTGDDHSAWGPVGFL
jgi:hypothetical protein